MKNLTEKNYRKICDMLSKKGYNNYDQKQYAINAFTFFKVFGFKTVEDMIANKY